MYCTKLVIFFKISIYCLSQLYVLEKEGLRGDPSLAHTANHTGLTCHYTDPVPTL